jgi:hypothetical protein
MCYLSADVLLAGVAPDFADAGDSVFASVVVAVGLSDFPSDFPLESDALLAS